MNELSSNQPDAIAEGKPVPKRKRVTFAWKQQVLHMLEEDGATPHSVSEATGVNVKTIYSWRAKKEDIIVQIDEEEAATKKASRKERMPLLQKMMVAWLETWLQASPDKSLWPTQKEIQTQALKIKNEILTSDSAEVSQEERNHLGFFNASLGWVTKWNRKHNPANQKPDPVVNVERMIPRPRVEVMKGKSTAAATTKEVLESRVVDQEDITIDDILPPSGGGASLSDADSSDDDNDDEDETSLKSPLDLDAASLTKGLAKYEKILREHQIEEAADALQDARYAIFRTRRDLQREQKLKKRKNKPQQQANALAANLQTAKKKSKPN
ncbi:unnamed protein product [Cylindrotheca closterium]|uniref:HTH CENPB-type domain-containing protein n=1 Tax=Cylindrotheca closterium TaxID=2856 RepID=A0AAD2FKN1_9STRA|nr:unnamed protein product [Cylindrotheca closterium]